MAVVGATPRFYSCQKVSTTTVKTANMIFYGIKFLPDTVEQTEDPQLASSTLSTYNKTAYPVSIAYMSNVRFYACEMCGYDKYLTTNAVNLSHCEDLYFERCHLHTSGSSITYSYCDGVTFYYNYLHETCASFFKDGVGNSNILIEGNHAHDMNWLYAEDWCPRASGQTYHGSIVAISGINITIRNNYFHDGGITGGIYMYGGYAGNNILIENNVLFDVHNSAALVLYHTGSNVIVRNNIVCGRGRYSSGVDGYYKYEAAMIIYEPYTGYDTSGISVYNNIFIGIANFYDFANILQGNNICWVMKDSTGDLTQEEVGTSEIIYNTSRNTYFDTGFFEDDVDRSWLYWNYGDYSAITLSSPGHQLILDYHPQAASDAINGGDATNQPNDSLGTLDVSNQYVNKNGTTRNSSNYDIGAYQ
jgi:hypothetical protein